jgi:GDP-D-mannose dehydratase
MQWRMLQQASTEDFMIATGRQGSLRRFFELTAEQLGWAPMRLVGSGVDETGTRSDTGAVVVRIDPSYFRPAEVETLLGDPTRAKEKLGWTQITTLEELVAEMGRRIRRNPPRKHCCSSRVLQWWVRWRICLPTQKPCSKLVPHLKT